MAQPRIAMHDKFDPAATKSLWLHANTILTAGLIAQGDLLAHASGLYLFASGTAEELFVGVSMGKTTVDMTAGVTGDYISVATKCIVEIDLTSATYTFGQGLGYTSKNTLVDATGGSPTTIAWYWGHDLGAASTRGPVLVDILALASASNGIFDITNS